MALEPNQIRRYVNKDGHFNYYMVIQDGKGKLGALWFRTERDNAMHLSWDFKMDEAHQLIMANANNLADVFIKLDQLHPDNK